MFGRQALIIALLSFGLSPLAQGAAEPARARTKAAKPAKIKVKTVRQKDGSIVVRLNLPTKAASGKIPLGEVTSGFPEERPQTRQEIERARNIQLMEQWLDAITEPRFMTALAAVAMEPDAEAKSLSQVIDPSSVRNWSEFVDPDLYLRWMASGVDPRFSQAIHNRLPDMGLLQNWIAFPVYFAIPPEIRAGVPLKPTIWSNAFNGGPGGQESVQAWLKLPMPDPKSNPWLRAGQNYRY